MEPLSIDPLAQDVLDSPQAGTQIIRGTAIRGAGYVAGLGLGLIAIPVLTRYLGVDDYGSYVVVVSLVGIAMIFADSGLSTVGLREYAVRDPLGRRRLMQGLVAGRAVLATLSAAAVVVFAVVAGYEPVLVAGTALGGLGLVLMMLQLTYAVPLVSGLRLGSTAALDFLRQLLTVAGILLLVAVGADLLGFFFLSIPVGVVVLIATIALLRRDDRVAPHIDRAELRYLVAEAAPAASATVLASLFYRVAIVTMSLVATAAQTGYFGLSFRVSEVFIAVPWLIVSSAFPVLARAAETDPDRLASAFRQMFDVCVILGAGSALVLVGGADPIIAILGGSEFEPAVSVLRIQGVAVAATFLVTLFGAMLWIMRAKRPLVVGNLVGVVVAIALTATLVSTATAQAEGAALAMLVAESLLAIWLGVALLGPRPSLRPSPRTAAKTLIALLAAVAVLALPIPQFVSVVVGSLVYVGALLAMRAVHPDIWRATFRPNAQ